MVLRLLVNATVQQCEETLKACAVPLVILQGNKLQPTCTESIKWLNVKAQRTELVHSAVGSKTSLVSKVCNTGLSSLPPALKICVLRYWDPLDSVLSSVTTLKKWLTIVSAPEIPMDVVLKAVTKAPASVLLLSCLFSKKCRTKMDHHCCWEF